jgi:hypothetical protein
MDYLSLSNLGICQHQCERDRPINPRLQETDIDKSAQKKTEGSGLKGLMNNLPAKAGG